MELKELFNLKDVRTKIMLVSLAALGVLLLPLLGTLQMQTDFYGYETTPEGVTTTWRERHAAFSLRVTEQAKGRQDTIEQKIDIIIEQLEDRFYLTGTATVGNFGADEAYVQINRGSDAKVYKDGSRLNVEVTNADRNTRMTLVVDGTFSDPNSDLLLRFSKRAAGRLGINGKCNIEIEPVAKK